MRFTVFTTIIFSILVFNACKQAEPLPQFLFFDDLVVQDSTGIPALNRMGPDDLGAPVDYTKGNLYVRFELIQKPGNLPLRPALFIWQDEDNFPNMGHIGVDRGNAPEISKEGVHYLDFKNPSDWWHGDFPIPDWGRPFDRMALVPWTGDKDEQYYSVDCGGNCFKSGNIAEHTPIVYRATGIWTPPGQALIAPEGWDCPPEWKAQDDELFSYKKSPYTPSNKELLLVDELIVHEQKDNVNKTMGFSEFSLPENVPSNWENPIPYKDGTVYFRVAILTKPNETPIYYQVGFQWKGGCEEHAYKEKFPNNQLMRITKPGTYNWQQDIPEWWEQDCQAQAPIDWTQRMDRLLVVVWDDSLRVMDDRFGFGRDDMVFDNYYPMVSHVQAVVVPPGDAFSGWNNYRISNATRFYK